MDRPRANQPFPVNDAEVGGGPSGPTEGPSPSPARLIAHDVREVIAAIQGALDLLKRDTEGTLSLSRLQRDTLLDGMGRAALRISRLVDNVPESEPPTDAPRRVPTDMAALVRRVVKDTDLRPEQTIELELDPIVVPLNPWQIERVVANLLQNAVRHARRGGTIRVGVHRDGTGGLICVDDDGLGVPEDMRDRIFEPFERGSTTISGLGIGLSLVAAFANAHGGRAWVEPGAAGGASFRVLLPQVSEVRPPKKHSTPRYESHPGSSGRASEVNGRAVASRKGETSKRE